jgi:hypothetical protein
MIIFRTFTVYDYWKSAIGNRSDRILQDDRFRNLFPAASSRKILTEIPFVVAIVVEVVVVTIVIVVVVVHVTTFGPAIELYLYPGAPAIFKQ